MADRGGLAAVHDAGAFRRRLLRSLQMQPSASLGLSEPVGFSAGAVSDPRHRRDRQPRSHQAALLYEPAYHQPVPDRATWSAAGLYGPTRARSAAGRSVTVGTLPATRRARPGRA